MGRVITKDVGRWEEWPIHLKGHRPTYLVYVVGGSIYMIRAEWSAKNWGKMSSWMERQGVNMRFYKQAFIWSSVESWGRPPDPKTVAGSVFMEAAYRLHERPMVEKTTRIIEP